MKKEKRSHSCERYDTYSTTNVTVIHTAKAEDIRFACIARFPMQKLSCIENPSVRVFTLQVLENATTNRTYEPSNRVCQCHLPTSATNRSLPLWPGLDDQSKRFALLNHHESLEELMHGGSAYGRIVDHVVERSHGHVLHDKHWRLVVHDGTHDDGNARVTKT